jgi:gliding motility-associated-like protein
VCIGQQVSFTNLTDTATNYTWSFGDGTTSNQPNPTHIYNAPGTYTVTLGAVYIDASGISCPSTIQHTVTITDHLPGLFTASATTGNCTPFVVTFSNQNLPSASTTWTFGDGTSGTGDIVTHTFDTVGTYQVSMHVIDPGGCVYDTTKTIVASGPSGTFAYTGATVCGPVPVRFNATAFFTDSIRWNFGDGTSVVTTGQFVYHTYTQPGIFLPSIELISGPNPNCRIFIPGSDTIKVDYLDAGFTHSLLRRCDSTRAIFVDTSRAYSGLQSFVWDYGDGSSGSGANVTHYYQSVSTYTVTEIVESNWGCFDTAYLQLPITISTTPSASITSPGGVCVRDTVTFTSNISSVDSVNLVKWIVSNGSIRYSQNLTMVFSTAGTYTVKLVVGTIYGCYDTAVTTIVVSPLPTITASSDQRICLGQSVQITANSSANTYQWTPLSGLSCYDCPNPIASPTTTTGYVVSTMTNFGCKARDTVNITVIQPFTMTVSSNDTICIGESVQLIANGAPNYLWTPAYSLSCNRCPDPIATPTITTIYTVTGTDSYRCFTQVRTIEIAVGQYPVISMADPSIQQTGDSVLLQNQITNGPIRYYDWTPPRNLNCDDCPMPKAYVSGDICYTLTAENLYGCKDTGVVCIRAFCQNAQVFIPNTFTPDGDNLNDVFYVRASGIKSVKRFRVYNRWGEIVFERSNFNPTIPDVRFGWDGKIRGVPATPDVFIYTAEVICDNDVPYTYKGNVTLIR